MLLIESNSTLLQVLVPAHDLVSWLPDVLVCLSRFSSSNFTRCLAPIVLTDLIRRLLTLWRLVLLHRYVSWQISNLSDSWLLLRHTLVSCDYRSKWSTHLWGLPLRALLPLEDRWLYISRESNFYNRRWYYRRLILSKAWRIIKTVVKASFLSLWELFHVHHRFLLVSKKCETVGSSVLWFRLVTNQTAQCWSLVYLWA